VCIAGPTCDSADILYERTDYRLPLALEAGDRVEILSTGAYTTTYSTVGFNGFPALRDYYLPVRDDQ
jgi:ornithine decarboxylase